MHQQDRTFTTPQLCALADVTYRQADYWTRVGYLTPVIPARGSGCPRAFDQRAAEIAWALGVISALSRSDRGGGQFSIDLDVLLDLTVMEGWLVVRNGRAVHCATSDELAWELELWPGAIVINLGRCPVADRVPDLSSSLQAIGADP